MSVPTFSGKSRDTKGVRQNHCDPQNEPAAGWLLEKVISVLPNTPNSGKMFTRDLWLKSRGSAILDLGESELVRSPDLFNLQLEGVFVRVVFHDVVVHVDQNPGKIKIKLVVILL